MIKITATLSKLAYLTAFISSLVFSTNLYSAGIYKWVDDQGNVHYDQQRPKSANAEKIKVDMHKPEDNSTYKQPGRKDANATEQTTDKTREENEKSDKTAEKPAETAAEKKQRLAACAQARKNLATIQSAGRIRSTDKDGNTTVLSQEQKEARMKQTKDLIAKKCK